MKYADINKRYTAIVTNYMAHGYTVKYKGKAYHLH